ncbi:hypothetical protein CSKR_100584 [Clonorchis sinensis]|uniref:Uncharacterized protein n=1 Tax=Clonorchis sinensis TaxID=79923 RepID=A0A419PZR5_CLOSI|nr:hypothetical protein CSKR_100584 [Clonorchis sinensis]
MRRSDLINIQSLLCLFPLLLAMNIVEYAAEAVQGCSVFFAPDFKWKKAICDSDSARLTNIPHDLPTNLIDLRVKQQLIPLISNKGLAQLTNLETLQIESSGVLRVTMDAFRSLTNLKYLNLQNNSLHLGINGLPKEALRSLPQLRTLNLAENPIDLVPDSFFVLSGGSQLQNLLLGPTKGVSMYIDPGAFMSLHKLRLLDLSFSKITSLPSNMQYTLDAMPELTELYLGGNPWHCDCKLRWLNRWFKKRAKSNIRFTKSVQNHHGQVLNIEPLCTTPDLLRDKPIFSPDLTDHSFQCTPKIITESQNVSVRAGETSTLSCEFYADPVSPVSWFKNGQQVQNGTRQTIIQRTTEETFVSDIQVTFDSSDDNTEWSCAIYSNDRPVGATFLLTVKPGVFTIQQSWIYAGIGSGILFVLLTAFGICIFYCCDPRNRPDQTINRWMGKNSKNDRLSSCYGCHKPGILFTNPKESPERGKMGDGNVVANSRSQPFYDPNDPPNSPLRQIYSSTTTATPNIALTTTSVVRINHNDPKLTPLGGSLIHETVATGENRFLVSCDGPEPTVLLATRISADNGMESPPSIYGLTGPLSYGFPSPLITTSQEQSTRNTQDRAFSGHVPHSAIQSSHIYARVNHSSDVRDNCTVTHPGLQYTSPCPVHGSMSFDRTTLHTKATSEERSSNPREDGEKIAKAPTSAVGTAAYKFDNIYSSPIKLPLGNHQHSGTTQLFAYTERCISPYSKITFNPASFDHSNPNNFKFSRSPSSLTEHEPKVNNGDRATDTVKASQLSRCERISFSTKYPPTAEVSDRLEQGKVGNCPVTLFQPSCPGQQQKTGIYAGPHSLVKGVLHTSLHVNPDLHSEPNKQFVNHPCRSRVRHSTHDSSHSSSKEPSEESWNSHHSSASSENGSLRTAPKQDWWAKSIRLSMNRPSPFSQSVKPKSSCAVHYPSWKGYSGELTSPDSGSTRSAYCISTLPSRFRRPVDVSSLMLKSTTSNRDVRRGNSFSTRSRPLIRPGSKHKLDTDSGTDYNE